MTEKCVNDPGRECLGLAEAALLLPNLERRGHGREVHY